MRTVRTGWRRLTSMRTALILLFLLAVAAVPGSLLPQTTLDPQGVQKYISKHGAWGRFLDALGMFDVFGSAWFAAIYLLLFVSLVGCLIPRIRVHARAMARKPLRAPRHLGRLPESGRFETSGPPVDYATAARQVLGRRWRVAQREEDGGVLTLSAEKGYSRETGNLVFHVALLGSLVLIAVGRLYMYEGTVIVEQGDGVCNSVSNYDQWTPGRFAAEGKVTPAPFCIGSLTKFTAKYGPDGEPRTFAADVTYGPAGDTAAHRTTITVNNPLRYEGDRVYLLGHGYSPKVTVTMPDGQKITTTAPFLPSNATTLFSEGVFKIPGKPDAKQDVGLTGYFAPSPAKNADGRITSVSPAVNKPDLGISVYVGDLNYQGLPQSVYSLDTSKMKFQDRADMKIGEIRKFGTGAKQVTVRFDGWVPWVNFQVSHDPAQNYLLISAAAMVLGIGASLGVRRRRIWLRITPDGSATVVRVGGLARSDSGNFTDEFAALLARLRAAGEENRRTEMVGAGKE